MYTPYFWLPVDKQEFVIAWMGALTAFLMVVRYGIGFMLRTRLAGVPSRVVALDIPLSLQRTEARVRVWKERGLVQTAFLKTRLDYLFFILYPVTLSLACAILAHERNDMAILTGGQILSWGLLLCIPCGVFINTLILKMLRGGYRSPVSHGFTALLRLFLFLLTGCGILYTAIAMIG